MFESAERLARVIDHTLVRPGATDAELDLACTEAREHSFAALIVSGSHVARAKRALAGTPVKVGAVVGFPHGMCTTTVKIVEAMEAMKNGADEVDIMMNVGYLRSGRIEQAEIDLKNVIAMTKQLVHKAILETGMLTPDEIAALCGVAIRAGAEYVKTCTGFGPRGTTTEDVRLVRRLVGASCRVKASGGIRDLAAVETMVEAGADRVGTSAGATIMLEYQRTRRGA